MDYVVGIDLGTCYSAVTYINSSGNSEIIVNAQGESLTPSVINFTIDDKIFVGTSAARVLYDEPDRTPAQFKRHMGTERIWQISNKDYSSTELSAFVLEKLKDDALSELKRSDPSATIAKAIITVPAEFSKAARSATVDAAQAAGLEVDQLLDEPTAAVLYHQHCLRGKSDVNGIYCIVDLGGGTFDISVVRVEGAHFSVIRSSGSVEIGGIDFDKRLQALVQRRFSGECTGSVLDEENFTLGDAEELKKTLSDKESHRRRFTGRRSTSNTLVRHSMDITRAEFEESIQELLGRIRDKCLDVMERSSLSPDDIRDVLLVGGSTRVPAVRRLIDDVFEKTSLRSKDCDEAVARGAGIFAASRALRAAEIPFNEHQRSAISDVELTEILHKSYGIISLNPSGKEEISFMLRRGSEVPCLETKRFHLKKSEIPSGEARTVEWRVVESDDEIIDPSSGSFREIQIEEMELPPDRISEDTGRKRDLTAEFRCDSNKVLYCEFVDESSGIKSIGSPILLGEIPQ